MPTFSTEQRDYTVDAKLVPLGYQQITSLAAVASLSPPQGARIAMIEVSTQAVRWRDDGVDPTSTVGMPIAAGAGRIYTGNLATFRVIEATSGAELNISYYF